jgi:SnoaL-like protein
VHSGLTLMVAVLSTLASGQAHRCERTTAAATTRVRFEMVMNEISAAWNHNDARRAAVCFAEDAVYSSMPSAKVHKGRKDLYEWFGGEKGRPKAMRMEWHHLVFDPEQQIGVGEYTFQYEVQTHGIVIVKFKHGLISNWREYEQESPQSWSDAVGENKF